MTSGNSTDDGAEDARAAVVMPARPGVYLDDLDTRDTIPPPVESAVGEQGEPLGEQPESSERRQDERTTVTLPARTGGAPPARSASVSRNERAADERAARDTSPDVREHHGAAPNAESPHDTPLVARPVSAPTHSPTIRPPDQRPPDQRGRFETSQRLRPRDASERKLLALAAVVGQRFWFSALRTLYLLDSPGEPSEGWSLNRVDERLNGLLLRLKQRRLIAMREPSSVPGELELGFVDSVDRDHLLRELPLDRRERLHRGVAAWMAAQSTPDRGAWESRRAEHLREGRRPEEAARAYALAADNAHEEGGLGDAVALLDSAVALLDLDRPSELARLHLSRVDLLQELGYFDEAAIAARKALQAAQIVGDRRLGGAALLGLAKAALDTEGVRTAEDRISQAEDLIDADAGPVRARLHQVRGEMLLARGRPGDVPKAVATLERALDPALGLRGPEGVRVRLGTLPLLGAASAAAGDGRRAERFLREAAQLSQEAHAVTVAVRVARLRGELDWLRGRESMAIDRWERALSDATTLDLRPESARIHLLLGAAVRDRGDAVRAQTLFQVALDDAELLGSPRLAGPAQRALATLGDDSERRFDEAARIAERHGAGVETLRVQIARIARRAEEGHMSGAADDLKDAVRQLDAIGDRALLARALVRLSAFVSEEEAEPLRARARAISSRL